MRIHYTGNSLLGLGVLPRFLILSLVQEQRGQHGLQVRGLLSADPGGRGRGGGGQEAAPQQPAHQVRETGLLLFCQLLQEAGAEEEEDRRLLPSSQLINSVADPGSVALGIF
jgi:hypothetical protein